MRRYLHAGMLLVALATAACLHAQTPASPATAEEWIAKANAVSDVQAVGAAPFHLHATFHAAGQVDATGDGVYDEVWFSPTRWRKEITLGPSHHVFTQSGYVAYEDPKGGYVPVRSLQVLEAILPTPLLLVTSYEPATPLHRFLDDHGIPEGEIGINWQSDKERTKKHKKDEALPLQDRRLVVELATGRILRNEAWVYSAFADFHGKTVARQGALQENNMEAASFEITALEEIAPRPDADFTLANESGHPVKNRPDIIPPKIISSVDPQFSKYAKKHRIGGNCLLGISVDPQGRVHDVRVIRSLEASLDANAITAVRQYQFAPATSNGYPINLAMLIEIDFHIW